MGEAKQKKVLGGPATSRRLELQRLFQRLGIDNSRPGFYDDPTFIAEERRRPLMLETYGEWVLHRERSAEYEIHVRKTLTQLVPIISARLDRHQWFGGCFAVSAMLTRMLDRLGVWNTIMKGSASIYAGIDSRHFTIFDHNEGERFETGHQWLIAPPYDVVDLTLYYQRWRTADSAFQSRAPKVILSECAEVVRARAQDVIAPALLKSGTDAEMHLRLRDQRRFGSLFPARKIAVNGLDIRYVPSGMTVSQEPLEGVNAAARNGVSALEVWREDVAPAFEVT